MTDADGYLWYQGRADDMFKAAGYRIGPSEIENCLVRHPAVANAAVVPSPDETRGNVVKAFVVLAPGHAPSAARSRTTCSSTCAQFLAPYEYPKEIEFIDALPMTTTGKVQRKVLREREAALARPATRPDGRRPAALRRRADRREPSARSRSRKRAVRRHPHDGRHHRRQDQRAELEGERDHLALPRGEAGLRGDQRPRR